MINLDTHVLIFALAGELTPKERRLLTSQPWSISGVVFWEIAKLVQLGRVDLDVTHRDVVGVLSSIHVWPIDLAVAVQSTQLDFNADPADELIAATSVVHDVPLLTRDRRILRSKMVPLA
ncbi:MAG TPA: type II toxin-antitoxin system VapC family toxin [Gemmatimonadaceae bacterium]|nr:type II toxin-antitoxin system VapC family toxin [Gemmatimonadaceae bacterium]